MAQRFIKINGESFATGLTRCLNCHKRLRFLIPAAILLVLEGIVCPVCGGYDRQAIKWTPGTKLKRTSYGN